MSRTREQVSWSSFSQDQEGLAIAILIVLAITCTLMPPASAQNFGNLVINRKKVTLRRKLPPQGHIEGNTFKLEVTASPGVESGVAADLKSTLESILLRSDSRLRSADGGRADTIIAVRVTSYGLPQPQMTSQAAVTLQSKKNAIQNQPMERVTGNLTASFRASDGRSGKSLAADNVSAKFDQEYTASGAQQGLMHSMTHTVAHLTKGGQDDDTPPTPIALHNKLISDAAQQIASELVNTSELIDIYLARGGALDPPVKLMEEGLWTRALEQLETMKPFPTPVEDAYRIYDLGVVNEALGYAADDIGKARKYLQQAAIDYGKAIDGKPGEKYFLDPQRRIDTALAHYKALGDQKPAAAPVRTAVETTGAPAAAVSNPSAAGSTRAASAGGNSLSNDDVISMVAARLDEPNIVETIQHAPAVSFDLSVKGQIDLSKNGVSGTIISAMKARARGTPVRPARRPASSSASSH